jgi:uncharacterized protein YndB with AHSA1/START domain
MTVRVLERVAVAAPPDAVFEALTDWERQSRWMAFTTVKADAGEHRVGERFSAFTGVGPVGFTDPMEVTIWDPPHRTDVRHLGNVVRGTGTFLVEPAPGGCWMTWIEDLELPLGTAGMVGFKTVEPLARIFLRRSMRKLAREVEAAARPGGKPLPF